MTTSTVIIPGLFLLGGAAIFLFLKMHKVFAEDGVREPWRSILAFLASIVIIFSLGVSFLFLSCLIVLSA